MSFKSKIILGIASLILSRLVFVFINDPEGPNLLIVFGMAVVIYVVSFAVHLLFRRR